MEAEGWEAYLKRACPSDCKPKQTVLVTEKDLREERTGGASMEVVQFSHMDS